MNLLMLEVLCIASLTALTCTIPGILLVLRGIALMSDAISHAVLLGIACMFLITQQLDSPLLLLGATLAGIAAVIVVEQIINTQKLKKDAALGLTFPLFFSLGVIIISLYARNAHLDTDMVLLGELAFAPFNRFYIGTIDCGPHALWILSLTTIINSFIVWLFYKEWQISLFDAQQAKHLGFATSTLHYVLMCLTSMSAVASFNIVGSLVVVALMIIPAASAYLCAKNFRDMFIYGIGFSIASSWGGYALAIYLNSSIAGSIAVVAGLLFGITLCFEPTRGIVSRIRKQRTIRDQYACAILATVLTTTKKPIITQVIAQELGWTEQYTKKILKKLINKCE